MTFRNMVFMMCLLFAPFLLKAQADANTDRWKIIDSLVDKKGLTQSALVQVNIIYAKAKAENNEVQLIKALLYRMRLEGLSQEDGDEKGIGELEKEIITVAQPGRSILESIAASAYWAYFQKNRYKLYNRTTTSTIKKDSISTWSVVDLNKRIGDLYLSSLKNEKLLQATKLDVYDPILIKGNVRALRPTLFDLLAHRALDYFKTDETDVSRPEYAFEIDDPAVFAPAAAFIQHHFRSKDSLSLHFSALQLFQKLITLHLSDVKADALLDADIERIGFANQYAVMSDKDDLYKAALSALTDRYGNEPAVAEAWYLQAVSYDKVKAKAICERVLQEKDSSEGKYHCQLLLGEILNKTLTIQTEEVNIPDEPFRSLVTWRNLSRMYIRIVQVNAQIKDKLRTGTAEDSYWTNLLRLPVLRQSVQSLPETKDYQQHRAEIKTDPLPAGEYAMICSSDSSFTPGKTLLSVQYFYVSAIAYFNNRQAYFIVDRKTGAPLAGANVQIWESYYDQAHDRNTLKKAESYQTDKKGFFLLKRKLSTRWSGEWWPEISFGKDHLFLNEESHNTYYNSTSDDQSITDRWKYEKANMKTFLFTDRSIYRPGQIVYFKGIVTSRDIDTHRPKVLAAFKTKLILYDANRGKVDSLELTTNDFGSYHGQFRLPENLLNGEFHLGDDSTGNEQYFSVEEYKRPSFYVQYDTLKKSYRLGDSVQIAGSVQSYAGNMVDGAIVKYRVNRQVRYRISWLYGAPREQEVAHGVIKTDAAGKFYIPFTAIPDRNASQSQYPVFNYEVSADVTDINGETRSGTTSVPVGYQSLELSIQLPVEGPLPADSLKQLLVRATDHSGNPVPALVHLSIYSLQSPDRLIRQRYWEAPDQFTMSRQEYLQYFPHDEYDSDQDVHTWKKTGEIFSSADSAGHVLIVGGQEGKGLPVGWYKIEAGAKDKDGQEVKDIQYVMLYDTKTGRPANPQYSWNLPDRENVIPGGTARAELGSSADNVFFISTIGRMGGGEDTSLGNFSFHTLDNERSFIGVPITEADRGGLEVLSIFVKDNRVYVNRHIVAVPWTNKELAIHYLTYRNKVLPGSGESWQVHISGSRSDQTAAEVLAGMYDASLDQFKPHAWSGLSELYPDYEYGMGWKGFGFSASTSEERQITPGDYPSFVKQYDEILEINRRTIRRYFSSGNMFVSATRMAKAEPEQISMLSRIPGAGVIQVQDRKNDADGSSPLMKDSIVFNTDKPAISEQAPSQLQLRKNFNETAFFLPDLRTDDSGNVSLSFTMPEALTRWKWMTLAHTRDLSFGYSEKEVITQKELMVQANVPRFLREGDRLELPFKVVNMTDLEMTGQIELQLTDPTTGQTADGLFTNRQPNQYFTVGAKQSVVVSFPIDVPFQYSRPLSYRVLASARNYSDGEEAILPVVSNRMLVTESLPLNMAGAGTKTFHFDKLLQSGSSETLNHHALTVEFTSNPAWYAVQALPYLMEYPYECAEQTFNRFYANALAAKIVSGSPRIRQVFERWKTADTAALLSNLEKNPELKSVLLQETPWVLEGKSESQQKKNIALLFDMVRMSRELASTLAKLKDMQSSSGGFVWFKGGTDDGYITQYILTGIAHLQQLQAIPADLAGKVKDIVTAAIPYADRLLKKDYELAIKQQKTVTPAPGPGASVALYLYMRSMFSDYGVPGNVFPALNYFRKLAQKGWLQSSKFEQGLIALALFRTGDVQTARSIMASLRENAIRNEDIGMYWKGMEGGYYWYQAPIETQSLLIEAFHVIMPDQGIERALRTWLLQQKRTHNWQTTKATADACYALLLGSDEGFSEQERNVTIRLGDKTISSGAGDEGAITARAGTGKTTPVAAEAGTGYFKKVFEGAFVNPSMGNITVALQPDGKTAGTSVAWGAVYWQYFEMLDKITSAGGAKAPLKLVKKLFVEKNTDHGPVLELVADNGTLHPGDKVKVRIEIVADRDLEYVHMKDQRAACMEPMNVLSGYQWQGGLGYYESTKDLSTDFFFSSLPRGTYVFEYPLFVGQAGDFSNGITNIECMYAPEFSYHSEGIRVNVEQPAP